MNSKLKRPYGTSQPIFREDLIPSIGLTSPIFPEDDHRTFAVLLEPD